MGAHGSVLVLVARGEDTLPTSVAITQSRGAPRTFIDRGVLVPEERGFASGDVTPPMPMDMTVAGLSSRSPSGLERPEVGPAREARTSAARRKLVAGSGVRFASARSLRCSAGDLAGSTAAGGDHGK